MSDWEDIGVLIVDTGHVMVGSPHEVDLPELWRLSRQNLEVFHQGRIETGETAVILRLDNGRYQVSVRRNGRGRISELRLAAAG